MSWFCNKAEAKAQMKICNYNKCPGCNKCISIEESAWAMVNYGTVSEGEPHPLLNKIVEKFDGKEIN